MQGHGGPPGLGFRLSAVPGKQWLYNSLELPFDYFFLFLIVLEQQGWIPHSTNFFFLLLNLNVSELKEVANLFDNNSIK